MLSLRTALEIIDTLPDRACSGCGRLLTGEEKRYYGHTCESCEARMFVGLVEPEGVPEVIQPEQVGWPSHARVLAAAEQFYAMRDATPTIRGRDDILAFAYTVLELR